jgi:hypothetical protein
VSCWRWRSVVCLCLVALLPVSLFGDDAAVAILRTTGPVTVNQSPAADSAALFLNDLIVTQKDSVARIEATGSTADLGSETIVQLGTSELLLEHGHVVVNTMHGLRVRAGCVTVSPANSTDWTRYEVTDLDGKVTVAALKQDVNMELSANGKASKPTGASPETLREGQQSARTEKCDAQETRSPGAPPILNSPWVIGTGIAAIGVLTCWSLCRTSPPLSPTEPNQKTTP